MNAASPHLAVLAAAGKTPPATERGPLLYLWWALQILVVIAVVYGVSRLVHRRSHNRRP